MYGENGFLGQSSKEMDSYEACWNGCNWWYIERNDEGCEEKGVTLWAEEKREEFKGWKTRDTEIS